MVFDGIKTGCISKRNSGTGTSRNEHKGIFHNRISRKGLRLLVFKSNVKILLSHRICSLVFSFFKLQHFKDVELIKVQMAEKASLQKEFDRLKQELQRSYEMKAKALMDREKNALDQIQKQQEVPSPFHLT